MSPKPDPIAGKDGRRPARAVGRVVGVLALGVAGMLGGGCSPPPGLIDAQPPGVDPRLKLARDIKETQAPATPENTPELAALGQHTPRPPVPLAPPTAKGEIRKTESGTTYETVREGSGARAKPGQLVTVNYTGTFDDGRVFDSTQDQKPFTVRLGAEQVITGWEETIPGMKAGEVRRLTVPPSAGYGASGKGTIPPNATLHFEVELLEIE